MLWHGQSMLPCGCLPSMELMKKVQMDGGWSNWYENSQEGLFLQITRKGVIHPPIGELGTYERVAYTSDKYHLW